MTRSRHSLIDKWFPFLQTMPNARLRLLCLPYAGGGARLFKSWPDALPAEVEVCAVQLPGREQRFREPAFDKMEPLVTALLEVLEALPPLPLAIFGHSMGALIAFEVARERRRRHLQLPAGLFVSGANAPYDTRDTLDFEALDDAAVVNCLREMGGVPAETWDNTELTRLVLPIIRADSSVCHRYTPTPEAPLDLDIDVFGGDVDPYVPLHGLLEWASCASGECRVHVLSGAHFFIDDQRPLLLRILGGILRNIVPTGGLDAAHPHSLTEKAWTAAS